VTEYIVPLGDAATKSLAVDFAKGRIVGFENGKPVRKQELEIRYAVAMYQGLKVEVFSNEHPPPHFRVQYQGSTANFAIADCRPINGDDEVLRYRRNVKRWWKGNKQLLIKTWNERRPSDCTVGEYRE
jgi:hypothetical protein